jgi:hypothetical protein
MLNQVGYILLIYYTKGTLAGDQIQRFTLPKHQREKASSIQLSSSLLVLSSPFPLFSPKRARATFGAFHWRARITQIIRPGRPAASLPLPPPAPIPSLSSHQQPRRAELHGYGAVWSLSFVTELARQQLSFLFLPRMNPHRPTLYRART